MADLPSAEQIFAGLPDALLIIDENHQIAKVNPVAENFLGQSARHLIGAHVADQIQFQDERLAKALLNREANVAARRVPVIVKGQEGGLVNFDIHTIPSDQRWRIVSIAPLPADGPVIERRSSEQEQFSVRAPDILGHEIKNPLAAIKGAAQLLDRSLSDDQRPLTHMIKGEVERIANLLDRMQSLSTKQPAKVEPANVHSLIDRARKSIETAHNGDLKITDQFDPSLPEVLVDPDAMLQVLTNLLSNAVDATKKLDNRDIQVITRYSFGASLSVHGSDQIVRLPVEIIVRDNGPGVPPELEQDIFSPFVSTKRDGQGLGLALVRKLINDMNGRVRYKRASGAKNTQFILFLPVAERG
ncbi:two-component system sensor histidine kinase NtrB [Parasphingorhabdus cellanae]|uniref:two-component system sensor histidine kinase NtrB n=1 Tax=Parasphingorhabdus cellanae TaxID=2806553 RepID=UPI0021751432|nr:ATP-binding protein [Parasphingorhabdus cellanae]